MKYIDEFRAPEPIKAVIKNIEKIAAQLFQKNQRPAQIMEVCGGHTHTLFKYGLQQLLPSTLEFIHGPGCPVCVLPRHVIDKAIVLARLPNVIFTTYGDAIRVPGKLGSLQQARAEGADVRVLYSALDALAIAEQNPEKEIVFFAIGFETTMPGTALVLQQAKRRNITNFSVLCHHITIVPTLTALLSQGDVAIDGFIGPGHVSAIIGSQVYEVVATQYHKPLVISGFEPFDMMQSLQMVLQQLLDGRCEIENQYRRVVSPDGNANAHAVFEEVFDFEGHVAEWRGLGEIPDSGVVLKPEYATFSAEQRFNLAMPDRSQEEGGACDQVIVGKLKPDQCPAFGTTCTPQQPIGALMVSTEGACSAYYRYNRNDKA